MSEENIKLEDRTKCGEVFYENNKILFDCLLCDSSFTQNQNEFIEHLEVHFTTLLLNNVEPKLEIKTEEFQDYEQIYNRQDPIITDDYDEDAEQLVGSNLKKGKDGYYHCPKENCNSIFTSLHSTREHIRIKHPGRGGVDYPEVDQNFEDQMFHCPFTDCKHIEITLDLIQKHMYDVHLQRLNKIEKFPCTKCDRVYNLKSSLREHLKEKHFIVFDDERVFIKEIRTFKSKEDGKYHCPKCEKKFSERSNIRSHLKTKHEIYFNELLQSNRKVFVKPEGYDDTPKPRVNTKELKISETDGLWHCPHCTESKHTKRRLYIHIKTKHIDNCVCKVCGKELASSDSLEIHMKRHGDPTFKCDYCEKSFYNRSNLMSHVRMHLGQKNYQCKYCDKRFTNGSGRKLHEKMVHEKKKDYQCETCGKEFFTHYDLKKHNLRHTGERAFQCHICQKSFYEAYLLKDHFKLHTGLKPHECNICGTKYARKGALNHHMKTHAKMKQQFSCEICNEKFTKNLDLTSHMTTHQYMQNFV